MKRILAGLLALSFLAVVVAMPRPAYAQRHGGHRHGGHFHGGHFGGGFAVGAFTGLVLGSAFAPPYYYYAPPPVVYQPAPAYGPGYGYPAPVYGPPAAYVPPQWVWNGYGWVLQPGYWR